MPLRPFSRGLSRFRREPVRGAVAKMGLPWDAYYVLTFAEARLTNSKLHPNSGAPNYNIAHNLSDLTIDQDLDMLSYGIEISDSYATHKYLINITANQTGNSRARSLNILQTGKAGSTGPTYPVVISAVKEATATGDIIGMYWDVENNSASAGWLFGNWIGIYENASASKSTGVYLENYGSNAVERGFEIVGEFTTGLDLSTATLTHAIKMGNAQTLYDGTNSLSFANLKTAFDHVTADGSSHTFIDQAVTIASTPTFASSVLFGAGARINANEGANDTLVLNAKGTGAILLNHDDGTGGVSFRNGAGTAIAGISADGAMNIGTSDVPAAPTRLKVVHSGAGGAGFVSFINTQASSATTGAGCIMSEDDGAAMASGHRLGFVLFGGAVSAEHNIQNRAGIAAFATQNWTSTNQGAKFAFEVTPNNSTTRAVALTIDQNGSVGIGSTAPAGLLHVGDQATNYTEIAVDGDLTFVGGAGLSFGDIYGIDETITCTTQNTWYQITFDTAGPANSTTVSAANNDITILAAGAYKIGLTVCCHSAVAHDFEVMVKKNNGTVDLTPLHLFQSTSVAGQVENICGSAIVSLGHDDTIEAWVQCTDAAGQDFIIDHCDLNLVQVGGT